jgi:hypothetical protein
MPDTSTLILWRPNQPRMRIGADTGGGGNTAVTRGRVSLS